MIVRREFSIWNLVRWQEHSVLYFAAVACLVTAIRDLLGWDWFEIPVLPVGVLGGALGIFVSFRTNAAYARWWEGRQLWGRLVNLSRTWSTEVLAFLPSEGDAPSPIQRRCVERCILYVHVLRCLLREQSPWEDADVKRFSTAEERARLSKQSNPTHAIVHEMALLVAAEANAGRLSDLRLEALDRSIAGFLDVQGGCERIKRTPMPPVYGYLGAQLTRVFGLLFPMAIFEELWILAIPLSVVLSMAFMLINEAGRVLEDPFNTFWNALPLAALSRTIESNLRDRLGDADVLPMLKPDENGVLM
ncbi:MAG: bestrophin family protein [Sandaracinus sp.]